MKNLLGSWLLAALLLTACEPRKAYDESVVYGEETRTWRVTEAGGVAELTSAQTITFQRGGTFTTGNGQTGTWTYTGNPAYLGLTFDGIPEGPTFEVLPASDDDTFELRTEDGQTVTLTEAD